MSEQKRYTAQEIERAIIHLEKDENDTLLDVFIINNNSSVELRTSDLVAMLRQAAAAEEELAKVKAQFELWKTNSQRAIDALSKELDSTDINRKKLEARLEAVVKECGKQYWAEALTDYACEEHNKSVDAILCAARGNGGALLTQTKSRNLRSTVL